MSLISVVIPTVTGREDHFMRCMNAYLDRSSNAVELISELDHPSCGLGWQAGAERATGDIIHLTCDDIEPLEGWDIAAMEAVERHVLPGPLVRQAGSLEPQSWGHELPDWSPIKMSTLPFMTRELWEQVQPLFTAHYHTDDFVGERARHAGWDLQVVHGYSFLHHWAQHRRGAGFSEADRMLHDKTLFDQAMRMVADGQWTEPWPREGR